MQTTKTLTAILILTITISLSGCGNMNKGQNGAAIGGGLGAALGQAIGRNTEATLIGVAIGTILGYIIGNEMDKYDKQQLDLVYERGVSGRTSSWINPDKGARMMTPQPAYPGANGQICRKSEISAIINGSWQIVEQTACRDLYGEWKLQ